MFQYEKHYQLQFPVDVVYDHWVSEDTVLEPAERLEIETVVGGAYRLITAGGFTMNGRFLELVPGTLLRYSWQWDGSDEISEVCVGFAPEGTGTEVALRHAGFLTEDSRQRHARGWDSYIAKLRGHLRRMA